MNGAQAVLQTLVNGGVDVCFTNPGTSEMHLVAGMDATPDLRGVLCLFEGAATGAADGYGRMAGRPACTLLHLGPGLANGLANLHNARRAGTPIVNIVGDHATYHKQYDAPLESDIDALAGSVSAWVRRSGKASEAGMDTVAAIDAARTGGVATLILPADAVWSDGGSAATVPAPSAANGSTDIGAAVAALRSGEPCVIMLGGEALLRPGLEAASRIAKSTGTRLLAETFPARQERGAGIPHAERLAYLAEFATAQLDRARHLILAGARAPVSFFAYPGRPSVLVPDGCAVHSAGLAELAEAVAPGATPSVPDQDPPGMPSGELTAEKAAAVIGTVLPEGAIVSDEANTSGLWLAGATAGAPPHDWLTLTGGAIGQGMPVATGAAIACPDRPVINLQAEGSAMYTLQALWTQAREGLDVTTVIYNNRSYAILRMELERVGAEASAGGLFDLPGLDFVALAQGMGVPATRATTAEELADQLRRAIAEPGPHLIEAPVPPI